MAKLEEQIWRILLIDDDEDDYMLTLAVLNQAKGCKVNLEWAATYDDGQQRLRTGVYDAVLVDYDLGSKTGVDLIRQFVAQSYPAPLILYSGRGSYEVDVEAMQAGATLYLTKTEMNPLLLERVIRYALERKQIEAELRLIMDATPVLLSYVDAGYRYRWVNQGYERWFGHTTAAVKGRYLWEILGEAAWLAIRPYAQRALSGEVVTYETELPYRDGGSRWVHVTYTPDRDAAGVVHGFVAHVMEVGDHKRAEMDLRKLSLAVEHSPATVVITDAHGIIEYVNPKFTQLTGYTAEEAFGQNPRILKSGLTSPQDYQQLWKTISAGDPWQGEFCNRKKNGDLYWESASISPIVNQQGVITHFVAVKEDITERKQAEEALLTYTELLKRSNQALEDFAFIASHDLREPLRKVQAFGNRLKADYSQALGDQGQDYIERMQQAATRMQGMLDGLLTYSRITTQAHAFIPVDLQQVVREVLVDLEARLIETGGQVDCDPLPVIEADPTQIHQLFLNLIGNALKFHRPNVPPQVKIACSPIQEHCVTISISDNGIGFDEASAGYLFKPFHRLQGKTEYEGSGMGLAICHKIVERHAGSITVTSQPGVGTTFQVTLPTRA